MRALMELVRAGRRDLDLVTFVGGLDVELLLAAGALRSVTSSSVSLGPQGRRAALHRSRRRGGGRGPRDERVDARRRAARGGDGRAVPAHPGGDRLRPGDRPRPAPGGRPLLRRVATSPSRRCGRTWRSSRPGAPTPPGNVQVPWPPDHLWDVDVVLARAARTTIVCAEEVVPAETIAREGRLTSSSPSRWTSWWPAPGGSWPTACAPVRGEDGPWLHQHASDPGGALLDECRPAVVHSVTDNEDSR